MTVAPIQPVAAGGVVATAGAADAPADAADTFARLLLALDAASAAPPAEQHASCEPALTPAGAMPLDTPSHRIDAPIAEPLIAEPLSAEPLVADRPIAEPPGSAVDAALAAWLAMSAPAAETVSLHALPLRMQPSPHAAAPMPAAARDIAHAADAIDVLPAPPAPVASDARIAQPGATDIAPVPAPASARDAAHLPDTTQAPPRTVQAALTATAREVERLAPPLAQPADTAASATSTPLATLAAAPHAHRPADPQLPPLLQLPAQVSSAEFAPALALTVRTLAHGGVHEARLALNPAEMGPIEVRIALDGAQAHVEFRADAAATRAAIEAGLPELAGALRESGLTLAGGGVHGERRRDTREPPRPGETQAAAGDDAPAATRAVRRVVLGQIDLYA